MNGAAAQHKRSLWFGAFVTRAIVVTFLVAFPFMLAATFLLALPTLLLLRELRRLTP